MKVCFAFPKNDERDRLIYDRRPENSTMPHLRWEALPSGACFTRMLLKPDEFVHGSGDDLKNFYYMLKLPAGWVCYNAVGRKVDAAVVKKIGGDVRQDHRLCFRVLGMVDRNACSIAQATHESVLQHHGLLQPEHKLVYGKLTPSADLWEGIYLDDLLITLKVSLPNPVLLDGVFAPPAPQDSDLDWPTSRRLRRPIEMLSCPELCKKPFEQRPSLRHGVRRLMA